MPEKGKKLHSAIVLRKPLNIRDFCLIRSQIRCRIFLFSVFWMRIKSFYPAFGNYRVLRKVKRLIHRPEFIRCVPRFVLKQPAKMLGIFKRLKEKWGVESTLQFVLINLTFAIAGSSILYLRPLIFRLLGISPEWSFLLRAFLYLLLISPVYFIILMITAAVFGQFRFFWNHQRKLFARKKSKDISTMATGSTVDDQRQYQD